MNILDAIKHLEKLKYSVDRFEEIEVNITDSEALKVAIEVLKDKSVKSQIKLNKEIYRHNLMSTKRS